MSAKGYLSPEGVARFMRKGYYSPVGVARKLVKAYCSPDGVARLAWEAGGRVRAYLYNRVKLPEPPKWDAAAAPEAVIIKSTIGDTYFYCGKDMLSVGKTITGIRRPYAGYILTDSGWSRTDYWLGSPLTKDILWTNYDVYYSDDLEDAALAGTLCLAASEPVPLCSYNGVELPELPEWDSAKFPKCTIDYFSVLRRYYFRAFAPDAYYFYSDGKLYFGSDYSSGFLVQSIVYRIAGNYGTWSEPVETDVGNTGVTETYMHKLIWANFDMEYDGTLYMAASDPQPVYI